MASKFVNWKRCNQTDRTMFEIKLERGQAEKSIFERTPEEIDAIGKALFERVVISSFKLGYIPGISTSARQVFIDCVEQVTGNKMIRELPEDKIEDVGKLVCRLYFQKLGAKEF